MRTLGYAALAALAYLPILLTSPGKVVADTKSYLYLDPGRLLARAPYMWTPNIALGTVTHQQIGYLWPTGPFFWVVPHARRPRVDLATDLVRDASSLPRRWACCT